MPDLPTDSRSCILAAIDRIVAGGKLATAEEIERVAGVSKNDRVAILPALVEEGVLVTAPVSGVRGKRYHWRRA